MINFLINKIARQANFFISCRLLIILLFINSQTSIATATNDFQDCTNNQKSLLTDNKITVADTYDLDQTSIKNEIISRVKNRLYKIKNIYGIATSNNISLPTEVNVSLQIALLDTITILDKSIYSIPLIKLNELQQQLTSLIKHQDDHKVFVATSLGFNREEQTLESDDITEMQNKLLELTTNYIPFELEYYNSELKTIQKVYIKPSITSNEIFSANMDLIQNILQKYQDMPIEQQQKHKLKINYANILFNSKYFNHKTTTIPHSVALYTRIKNNKIDILVFEPLQNISVDYNMISIAEVLHTLIQQVITNEANTDIKFNIHEIPLSIELCGTDCITHAYEVCKEINANIAMIDNICDSIETNVSRVDAYKYIFNNVPITFFKTISQLDILKNIFDIKDFRRANEVSQLKANLVPYCKTNFNFFSTSIYEMGLYWQDKNKLVDKVKFYYPESNNSHNYLGCFTNVNTLIQNSQLQLAEYAINCLSDNNIITNLQAESLLKLDNTTADIDTINNNSLDEALEFAIKVATKYKEYAKEYHIHKIKKRIDFLICIYDFHVKQQNLSAIKEQITEIQVVNEVSKGNGLIDYQNMGSIFFNIEDYKKQITEENPKQLLINSLKILNTKIKTKNFDFCEEEKKQLEIKISTVKNSINNILDNIKNDIQHLFITNDINIQTANFSLQTKYSSSIDLSFFKMLNSNMENIIKLLNMNSNNFFQEILKEQTISTREEFIKYLISY